MKAYVVNAGCEQRGIDSQRIVNYLEKNSFEISNNPKDTDYAFIITCGVNQENVENSLKLINETRNEFSKKTKLLIGGCLGKIRPDLVEKQNPNSIFSPSNMDSLDEYLKLEHKISDIPNPNYSINDQNIKSKIPETPREYFDSAKKGYKIKISEGCLGSCSYCSIRSATGNLNSESIDIIVNQVKSGISKGQESIILMAGDTGAYGQDQKSSFHELLNNIIQVEGKFKLYVHDFGVNWLIKNFNEYVAIFDEAELGQKIGGITIPIQSGSNRILKNMKRKYDIKDVQSKLTPMKKYSFFMGTHIMVGFPGETKKDFQDTIQFLEDINFDFFTCFPYSDNPGTEAFKMPNKIPKIIINERINILKNKFEKSIKVMA